MSRKPTHPTPSFVEVTLGVFLSLVLGASLAAGYLIVQPVETVRVLPKEPDQDKVYYVIGSNRTALGRQWLRKKQMLVEQGTIDIDISEDELNTWMASSESKPDGEAASGIFVAKSINFRINDGVMQIGMPCTLSLAGITRDIVVQAQGTFQRDGEVYAFVPDRLMLGTLDVKRLPLVSDMVYSPLLASQTIPEELVTAWKGLNRVEVEGNVVKLTRR